MKHIEGNQQIEETYNLCNAIKNGQYEQALKSFIGMLQFGSRYRINVLQMEQNLQANQTPSSIKPHQMAPEYSQVFIQHTNIDYDDEYRKQLKAYEEKTILEQMQKDLKIQLDNEALLKEKEIKDKLIEQQLQEAQKRKEELRKRNEQIQQQNVVVLPAISQNILAPQIDINQLSKAKINQLKAANAHVFKNYSAEEETGVEQSRFQRPSFGAKKMAQQDPFQSQNQKGFNPKGYGLNQQTPGFNPQGFNMNQQASGFKPGLGINQQGAGVNPQGFGMNKNAPGFNPQNLGINQQGAVANPQGFLGNNQQGAGLIQGINQQAPGIIPPNLGMMNSQSAGVNPQGFNMNYQAPGNIPKNLGMMNSQVAGVNPQGFGMNQQAPGIIPPNLGMMNSQGAGVNPQGFGMNYQAPGNIPQNLGMNPQGAGVNPQGFGMNKQAPNLNPQNLGINQQGAGGAPQGIGLNQQGSQIGQQKFLTFGFNQQDQGINQQQYDQGIIKQNPNTNNFQPQNMQPQQQFGMNQQNQQFQQQVPQPMQQQYPINYYPPPTSYTQPHQFQNPQARQLSGQMQFQQPSTIPTPGIAGFLPNQQNIPSNYPNQQQQQPMPPYQNPQGFTQQFPMQQNNQFQTGTFGNLQGQPQQGFQNPQAFPPQQVKQPIFNNQKQFLPLQNVNRTIKQYQSFEEDTVEESRQLR